MSRFFLAFFLFIPVVLFSQHQISGTFSPAGEYEFVLLYKLTPEKRVYVADSEIDQQGNFTLKPEKMEPGVYKLIYKLPEETYNFDIVYNGKEDVLLSYVQGQGVIFKGGQNKILQDYLKETTSVEQNLLSKMQNESVSKEEINGIFAQLRSVQSQAENNADEFTKVYIQAFKPYIPEKFENKSAFEINKKSNYFDHLDTENPKIQASSFPIFLIKKYYYEYVTLNEGVGYRDAINDIYRETKSGNTSYDKVLMTEFWIYLTLENKQNAANYLAERYLLALAKADNDTKMVDELEQILSTSVGAKAPNFELKGFDDTKTLYDVSGSQYYLLIFWSSECSHCVAQVPVIHKELRSIPSNKVQTVAVGIEFEDTAWKKMTADFSEFINVLALDEWRNNLTLQYNVTGTPTFFILDADKRIVAKPRSTESLLQMLESIKNY